MSKPMTKSTGGRGGAAGKREAAKPRKAIFNAAAVAARLAALREAAVETIRLRLVEEGRAAADAAKVEFDEASVEITDDEVARTHWWGPALKFDWASARKGNNGTQWLSNEYRDEHGVAGPLVIRINGERHTGQIMPITDEAVAELAARVKNPNVTIKKRDKKPSIQIQKWAAQVKTLDDGITVATDEDGRPLYPDDDMRSAYYLVAEMVNEAFVTEAKERLDRGAALLATANGEKLVQKSALKAQGVLDTFAKVNGPRFPGDIIFGSDTLAQLRKLFPNPKEMELLLRGALQAPNVKIAQLVQTRISDRPGVKNAGLPLPNPMTRIAMNFDTATGMAQLAFYDKDKPFEANGKKQYDIGKVDDDPVNAENIHKFVLSRSTLDGIVNMDSVCFSNMGISMPVKADVLVVEKPKGREVSLDDVYDDDGLMGGYGYGGPASLGDVFGEGQPYGAGEGQPEPEPEPEPASEPSSPPPQPSPAAAPPKSAAAKPAPAAKPAAAKPAAGSTKPPAAAGGKAAEPDYGDLLQGLGAQ